MRQLVSGTLCRQGQIGGGPDCSVPQMQSVIDKKKILCILEYGGVEYNRIQSILI
jgi:hypothetical protein